MADSADRDARPNVAVRNAIDRAADTEQHPRRSVNQKALNSAHTRLHGPGKRANPQLTSWKILRTIRSSPSRATLPVKAVQTLIHAG